MERGTAVGMARECTKRERKLSKAGIVRIISLRG